MISLNNIQLCAVAMFVNGAVFSTAMAQKSTEIDESARGVQDRSVEQFVQRAVKGERRRWGMGRITKDEAKQLLRKNFANVDSDEDGVVTAEELAALARRPEWKADSAKSVKQSDRRSKQCDFQSQDSVPGRQRQMEAGPGSPQNGILGYRDPPLSSSTEAGGGVVTNKAGSGVLWPLEYASRGLRLRVCQLSADG